MTKTYNVAYKTLSKDPKELARVIKDLTHTLYEVSNGIDTAPIETSDQMLGLISQLEIAMEIFHVKARMAKSKIVAKKLKCL